LRFETENTAPAILAIDSKTAIELIFFKGLYMFNEKDIEELASRDELENRRRTIIKRRRIIRFSLLGAILLIILFLCLYQFTNIMFGLSENLESAPQSGEWTMFRRDQGHTGTINLGDVLPKGILKWSFETGSAIHSSPAVVNGIVYVGSRDYNIYALDAKTGEKIWAFRTGSWVESSPVVVNGVVYCGSNDGELYALDATTGAKLWSFPTDYAIRSSPAVADGKVYIGSDDYHVYAVDATTGTEVWNCRANNLVLSSPAVTEGIVVVGSMDGSCYAINAQNGRHRLEFQTHSSIVASPAVKDGIAYIINTSGVLWAIKADARNWLWENKLKVFWNALWLYGVAPQPPMPSGYLWSTPLRANVNSSPAILDNNIYLGSGNNVVSLDLSSHETQWTFTTGDWVMSSPAVTDTVIYVGSYDGRLYALDRATGTELWDSPTGDIITSSPAVADGMVYVGSHDGKLYAFE
jgi:outer membrane protein assembly factor BamB